MKTPNTQILKNLSLGLIMALGAFSGTHCLAAVESGSPIDFFSDLRRENTLSLEEINQALAKTDEDSENLGAEEKRTPIKTTIFKSNDSSIRRQL
jgi:hypothetical protein